MRNGRHRGPVEELQLVQVDVSKEERHNKERRGDDITTEKQSRNVAQCDADANLDPASDGRRETPFAAGETAVRQIERTFFNRQKC